MSFRLQNGPSELIVRTVLTSHPPFPPLCLDRYHIEIATQLGCRDASDAQLVVTLSADGTAHLLPDTTEARTAFGQLSQTLFLHTIDRESGKLQGYRVTSSGNDSNPVAVPSWVIRFDPEVERIAAVGFKRNGEKVNSLGEVLGDRSVIHK